MTVAESLRSQRVVIVDDTPEIRALLRLNFELEPDFTVVGEGGDGLSAIELARDRQPDLVVLDLAMPLMDGLQALPELTAAAPQARVLVLSGFNAEQAADQALALGAHAYIEKGIRPELLLARAREVLSREAEKRGLETRTARPEGMSAEEVQRYIDEVAMAIHELRGPLTSINGFSSTLVSRWEQMAEEQKLGALRMIDEQSQRLTAMVSDLLMMSRLEARQVRLAIEEVELHAALERAAAELGGGTIGLECDTSLRVLAEPTSLQQILSNYLRNALNHGAPPIEIEVSPASESVEVRVRDAGVGVDPEFVTRLFEKCSRVRRADGTSRPGSGLGLAIVKRLVEAQGGRAWYEPCASGACFAFALPRADP